MPTGRQILYYFSSKSLDCVRAVVVAGGTHHTLFSAVLIASFLLRTVEISHTPMGFS
jgi:L-arabinose isomerase